LSKKYDLTLLSLCESEKEMNMQIEDNVFKKVYRVKLSPLYSYLNVLLSIPTNIPLQIAYYKSTKFRKLIDELLPEHDACIAHLIRVGDYIKDKKGIRILEMTDAISLNYKRVKINKNTNLRSIIYSIEQKRLEHYERKMASHFDLVSFVSHIDKDFLYKDKNKGNVKVYSNGVDTTLLKFKRRHLKHDRPIEIIFIGNMYSLQNMDAVIYFAHQILPYLNREGNYFNLKVIGKIREVDRRKLQLIKNVTVTGIVNSVSEAAEDGHIGICPMRIGAGLQNKILEYMALGLPCITSTVGFEGTGATRDREIFVADTLTEYKEIFEQLLSNHGLYENVALNARQFVETKFSWNAQLGSMIGDIDNLLGE
ncbi:TPA: glycosyltransferase, partial [Escherichia coli]|nr:glycosyltransferase [Escherichia coli]